MDDAGVPENTEQAVDTDIDMSDTQDSKPASQTVKPDVKLEDLFDDLDSDEDIPSSAPVQDGPPSSLPVLAMGV